MPIVATHPISKDVKPVTKYQAPDYGQPGIIWCPFCDHSYQDSALYLACPNPACRATRVELTDEQFRDLINPPLEVLVEREVETVKVAVETLRGSKERMDALRERAEREGVTLPGDRVARQKTAPVTPEGHTSGEGTEVKSESEGSSEEDEPPEPDIPPAIRFGWRAPTLEDGPMDAGRIVHDVCGKNYVASAGPMASHEKHCKGAPEKAPDA